MADPAENGEKQPEGGALAWFAIDGDVPIVVFHDAVDHGKAETGTFAGTLVVKKGSKIRSELCGPYHSRCHLGIGERRTLQANCARD